MPSAARIYDHLLGGTDNFAADREAAQQLLTVIPDAADAARANRVFLAEAVTRMAQDGIRQFLDLGAGIPTAPNVHELARAVHPDAAVVYVDVDPVVIAHDQALLASETGVAVVQRDLREPEAVLGDPVVRGTIDFSRPVGLVLIAVLHFVELRQAPLTVQRYVEELAPGSQIAISVGCRDGIDEEVRPAARAIYGRTSSPVVGRTWAQIEELFDGLDLLPPGLEDCYRSRSARVVKGIAVKPGT